MLYYSTLGYANNPLLKNYREIFLLKLQHLWKEQIDTVIPPDDFLLYPDIHSLLLANNRILDKQKEYTPVLNKKWLEYKNQWNIFLENPTEYINQTIILLTLDFQNPDINQSFHPDHKKNQVGITFWSIQPHDWKILFEKAFSIVRSVSPGFMTEIGLLIRKIIPFDVSYQVHNSGSYKDAIGHLLMSYPTGIDNPELALLEAIIHEYNHNKLNLILQTERLLFNDYSEKYYSPYRPDARHIHGIYLGVHAIVGAYWVILNAHVSWILTLDASWKQKAFLHILKNGLALKVIDKYAILSPLWREILEDIRSVQKECFRFLKQIDISPEQALSLKEELRRHYEDVRKNYPYLQS